MPSSVHCPFSIPRNLKLPVTFYPQDIGFEAVAENSAVVVALVDRNQAVRREQEQIGFLVMDQSVEFMVEPVALRRVEAEADFLDEFIRFRIRKGDMVAGRIHFCQRGVPKLIGIGFQGACPCERARVELLLFEALDQHRPFDSQQIHLDAAFAISSLMIGSIFWLLTETFG